MINPETLPRPDPLVVGAAYASCLLAYMGCLNPARALGAAFVFKLSWEKHWVFWVGPLLGGVTGAFAFEYIFSARRRPFAWDSTTTTTSFGGGTGLGAGSAGFGPLNSAAAAGTTNANFQVHSGCFVFSLVCPSCLVVSLLMKFRRLVQMFIL